MPYYICPKCNNYTYDSSLPCPKCGFNFQNSKYSFIKVKNNTNRTIYYDFSYGAGLSIPAGGNEIIKLKDHVVLTFFFHVVKDDGEILSYSYDLHAKNEKCLDVDLIERDGRYLCSIV